jgi:hypothetical protein
MIQSTPTVEQAESLVCMARHFNEKLFDNALDLSRLIICWTRAHQVEAGHFAPEKWWGEDGPLHELAINANVMKSSTVTELCACMVHEMFHALQHQRGESGRPGYHNSAFCDAMAAIGLPQKNPKSGEPVKPGSGAHSVAQTVAEGDTAFNLAMQEIPDEALPVYVSEPDPSSNPGGGSEEKPEKPEKPKQKPGARAKYTCPICGLNAWAKPGAIILCGGDVCSAATLVEMVGGDGE